MILATGYKLTQLSILPTGAADSNGAETSHAHRALPKFLIYTMSVIKWLFGEGLLGQSQLYHQYIHTRICDRNKSFTKQYLPLLHVIQPDILILLYFFH